VCRETRHAGTDGAARFDGQLESLALHPHRNRVLEAPVARVPLHLGCERTPLGVRRSAHGQEITAPAAARLVCGGSVPDRVFIQGLELYCVIGLQAWERQVMQKVRIDLAMTTDCQHPATSDDPALALDYRAVSKRVQQLVEGSSFQLVEALAEKIAAVVLAEFPRAASVIVRVGKPGAVRFAEAVGVEIERSRGEASR
jgi:dihydroneopterin aldolase